MYFFFRPAFKNRLDVVKPGSPWIGLHQRVENVRYLPAHHAAQLNFHAIVAGKCGHYLGRLWTYFSVERKQCFAVRPFKIVVFTTKNGAYPGLRFIQSLTNLRLRNSRGLYLCD